MSHLVTALAATMPVVLAALLGWTIQTEETFRGVVSLIVAFGITVGIADWYFGSNSNWGIMIAWYIVVGLFTIFMVIPAAGSDSSKNG